MNRVQRKYILAAVRRRAAFYLAAVILLWGAVIALPAAVWRADISLNGGAGGLWKHAVKAAVPVLESQQGELSWQSVLWGAAQDMLYLFSQVRAHDLKTIIGQEIVFKGESEALSFYTPLGAPPKAKPFLGGKTLVGIYHTHTAESFVPTDGRTHAPGGTAGEIVKVGRALKDALAKEGIGAAHSASVHDYPSFMRAYGASEKTAQEMIEKNKELVYIFDIHRDAEKRERVLTEIDGQAVASISIIVTQGQEGLEQPHWEENYAAARLIKEKCDAKYPGLIRGIQFDEWRYNEHLHKGLLLLEIGSHETGGDEAARAAEYFAAALAALLKENN